MWGLQPDQWMRRSVATRMPHWAAFWIVFQGLITASFSFAQAPGTIVTLAGGDSREGRLATEVKLHDLKDLIVSPEGEVYFSEGRMSRIWKITREGRLKAVAGTGFNSPQYRDGDPALESGLPSPAGLAISPTGMLYFSTTTLVNAIDSNGKIYIIAGSPGRPGSSGDGGSARNALLNLPQSLAFDPSGNLYIGDTGNDLIRKVDTQGTLTTVAGSRSILPTSGEGLPATQINLAYPQGLAFDKKGNLYFVTGGQIREVTPEATVRTVADLAHNYAGFSGDGGSALAAKFNSPSDLCADAAGNIYVADSGNHRIRKINTQGIITTVAGNGKYNKGKGLAGAGRDFGDGGPATDAYLYLPTRVDVDPEGALYILDSDNNRIRKVNREGVITTIAGGGYGDGKSALQTSFLYGLEPTAVAADPFGNVYVASEFSEVVQKIGRDGILSTAAGGGLMDIQKGALATDLRLNPRDIAADSAGNLHILTDSRNLLTVDSNGIVTSVLQLSGWGIGAGPDNSVYLADGRLIRRVSPQGDVQIIAGVSYSGKIYDTNDLGDGGPASQAKMNAVDVAVDPAGNIFVADAENNRIRRIDARTGIITTVAGSEINSDRSDIKLGEPATHSILLYPSNIAVDRSGDFYFQSLKVDSQGILTAPTYDSSNPEPGESRLPWLRGTFTSISAVDDNGSLIIDDAENARVRKAYPSILPEGPFENSPRPSGDVNGNGKVELLDVTLALQSVVGLRELDLEQRRASDLNGDEKVELLDVVFLLRKVIGL